MECWDPSALETSTLTFGDTAWSSLWVPSHMPWHRRLGEAPTALISLQNSQHAIWFSLLLPLRYNAVLQTVKQKIQTVEKERNLIKYISSTQHKAWEGKMNSWGKIIHLFPTFSLDKDDEVALSFFSLVLPKATTPHPWAMPSGHGGT